MAHGSNVSRIGDRHAEGDETPGDLRFSISTLSILDEHGDVDASLEPDLSEAELHRLYRAMFLAREADQRMLKLQRQGRMGTFPLSTGQEAAVCGPTFALRESDWYVGAYRDLGGRLLRGEPLATYMQYWNGFEEGNVCPEAGRTLPTSVIVGAQTLHAVGVAYAMKYREEDAAVLTFLGDGGTSQGDFHEAMNFAAVWQAPVVFVCVNNQWAISMPRRKQTWSRTIAQKAVAYDMPGVQVDGNDALATYRAAKEALDRARSGGGPTFIEAVTYRLMMHTTADDPTKYQTEDEVANWWKRDPVPRFRKYLEKKGLWDAARQTALDADVKQEVDATVKTLESAYEYKPDAQFDHVFATPPPRLQEQRAQFLDNLKLESGNG
jgi:pyruvate dehydrogenase E1 component alpha subunit